MSDHIEIAGGKSQVLEKINVLVIDDDLQITRLVKAVLSIFGFARIHVEHSAETALEVLRLQPFHFILVDWQMKGLSGVDFVKQIRHSADSINRFIPIIMLTGKAAKDDVKIARDAGVTEFLVKPFAVKDLRKKIIEIIQNPRSFVISENYVGPDRRRRNLPLPSGVSDRRKPEGKK